MTPDLVWGSQWVAYWAERSSATGLSGGCARQSGYILRNYEFPSTWSSIPRRARWTPQSAISNARSAALLRLSPSNRPMQDRKLLKETPNARDRHIAVAAVQVSDLAVAPGGLPLYSNLLRVRDGSRRAVRGSARRSQSRLAHLSLSSLHQGRIRSRKFG